MPPLRARLMSLLVRPTTPPLWLGVVVAACLIAGETLLVHLLKQIAPENAFGLLFMLGILVVSARWGFGLAVMTTLASAAAYAYVHLEGGGGFTLSEVRDWVAIVVFVPIALLANILAGQARLRAAEADQRRREAEAHRDELRVLADQQAALRHIATLVARAVPPSEVFTVVAAELARWLHVMNAGLLRYEADGTGVVVAVQYEPGITNLPVAGERIPLADNDVGALVLRTGCAARIDNHGDTSGPEAARIRNAGIGSVVGVPVIVDGRLWGAAIVGSSRPERLPADTEARLADFADLVAIAIANAQTRAELTASRARIVAAADGARRRFERDLHDGAQQRLVSLGLQMRTAEASVPPDLPSLKEQISDIVGGLTGVSHDLQEISRGIHPAILSRGGLGPALRTLARRCNVPVELHLGVDRRLPDSVEVAAYYVVAEALTNAAKYAQASEVSVNVTADDSTLRLSIRDDGIGGADSGRGSGLVGLVDRVEALGGQMQISSPTGSGTSLLAAIPFDVEHPTANH